MDGENKPWQDAVSAMEAAWSKYSQIAGPDREDFKTLMTALGEASAILEAEEDRTTEALEALIRLHRITIQAKFYEKDGKVEKTRTLSPKAKKLHKERIAAYLKEMGSEEKTGFLHNIFKKF